MPSPSPHKHTQSSRGTVVHGLLGIQQHPQHFLENSAIAMILNLPTTDGIGVVWNIHVSGSHQLPFGGEIVTIYSKPMTCPNCNCQLQVGAQIESQRSRDGTVIDVSIKRLDIARISVHIGSQLLRLARSGAHDTCEPLTYYILVRVQVRDRLNKTYWKITV